MASLYKKPVIVRDPKTGEKVKAKSKKWWGRYTDAMGRERRVPLATDKRAAQAMLNDLVKKVERDMAGLVDPVEDQLKRPLAEHLDEFRTYLSSRAVTEKHLREAITKIRKMVRACKWHLVSDITAADVTEYLARLRRAGLSAQTHNHYLKAIKQFTRWLARERRIQHDPLAHLSRLNVKLDRRHDRRALSQEEFARLIEAARNGKPIEGISGPDRAMMYVLAAWTGFRKGEIGSLTLRSLRLDDDSPTATVAACYSKRRREDTQILHPEVVRLLREWLATKKNLKPNEPLFPISGRVRGGRERKAHQMIELDLMAARDRWIEEANTEAERKWRLKSDFLCYSNHDGLYADFHSLRHLFITNLERAGIRPKMAQTLARHSDIRLTLGVYTHVELHDQTAAIESLPVPPELPRDGESSLLRKQTA